MWGRRAVRAAVGVCLVVSLLLVSAWAVALVPLSTYGEFTETVPASQKYTLTLTVTVPESGYTTQLTRSEYGNGTSVQWYDRPTTADGPEHVTTVFFENRTASALRYRTRTVIESSVRERATRLDGATAYLPERTPYDGFGLAVTVNESLARTQFVRNGVGRRAGERLARYDAVGVAGNDVPPSLDRHPDGFVLVEPATGALRALSATARYRGEEIRIRLTVERGARPLPSWARDGQANRSTTAAPST